MSNDKSTFWFVFSTPKGETCAPNQYNIYSISKSKDRPHFKFTIRDTPIIQHPVLLKWSEENLKKEKFNNFRTFAVELTGRDIGKYYDSKVNRFKYRKICLKKIDPPKASVRARRVQSIDSIPEAIPNNSGKRTMFDLESFMDEKNVSLSVNCL